jgi:preprotein translocase subunit SecG
MVLTYLLTALHIVICLFLIIVVLLQSGKAADLAGAFGGMGSQTVFGPRGSATVLSKATTIAAVLFMVTSLSLSIMATRNGKSAAPSILDKVKPTGSTPVPAPVQPGGQVPLTVTPQQGEDAGKPTQLQVPVVPLPPKAGQGPAPTPTPAPAQQK